jgi:hypothetical protein
MRDNRCPECGMGAIIVAYLGRIWLECASKACDWTTMGCPVEPSLEVKLDHFAMGYLAPQRSIRNKTMLQRKIKAIVVLLRREFLILINTLKIFKKEFLI